MFIIIIIIMIIDAVIYGILLNRSDRFVKYVEQFDKKCSKYIQVTLSILRRKKQDIFGKCIIEKLDLCGVKI